MSDIESIAAVTSAATPIIQSVFESVISPKIKELKKSKDFKEILGDDSYKIHFEEYLLRTYKKLSYVNTLVFPNQQTRLSDIYVPLTLQCKSSAQEHLLSSWDATLFPAHQRILITDTAGMGKSTILKWLFLHTFDAKTKIPLFIELKSLNSKSISEKIIEDLSSYEYRFPETLLQELLSQGAFLIFLDGYDEIPPDHKDRVTKDIQDFVLRSFSNWFSLSSRSDPALSCLGDFKAFHIKPLTKKDAFTLLKNYDKSGKYASALISELNGGKYDQVKDLLRNPMLVSLLFKAYTFKAKVPFRKHIFYRQVFDALFEAHDFTKGENFTRPKYSGLDIDDFHAVLRELGFITAKQGRVDFTKDKILGVLTEIRDRRKDIPFQPNDFLRDLVTTVPLFTNEGEIYDWAHKSVQDYFASQFIYMDAKGDQKSILLAIYKSDSGNRFSNVIDLLYDTDPALVRQVLIRKVIQDFIVHYENALKKGIPNVSAGDIHNRKCLTFGRKTVFIQIPVETANGKKMNRDLFEAVNTQASRLLAPRKVTSSVLYRINDNVILASSEFQVSSSFLIPLMKAKNIDIIEVIKSPVDINYGAFPKLSAPTVVDEDANSPLNAPDSFALVNATLSRFRNGEFITIDQSKARLRLNEIEAEIAEASGRISITEGI